jgi:hypothetical protein
VGVVEKEIPLRKKREAGCRAVNGEGPRKGRKKETREIKREESRESREGSREGSREECRENSRGGGVRVIFQCASSPLFLLMGDIIDGRSPIIYD